MEREIGLQDYKAYKVLVKHLKRINPDIVHCHSSKAGIVGRMAARHTGIRCIVYTPNAYAFQNAQALGVKKLIRVSAERFLSRYATTLTINVSKGEMQEALKYKIDRSEKFTLIYNGIPEIVLPSKEELKKELGLKNDVHYVGVTARCAEQKNPMNFLTIAEKVVGERDDVEFIYIGDGEMMEQMREFVFARGLSAKVHLLGFRSDASRIVGALDIYLSTALYEGLPYSMIEAMRAGVPIIATDTVGNNELVVDGENGRLFEIGDVDEAVKLINNQLERKEIKVDSVRNSFKENFSLRTMMNKTNAVYARYGGVLSNVIFLTTRYYTASCERTCEVAA